MNDHGKLLGTNDVPADEWRGLLAEQAQSFFHRSAHSVLSEELDIRRSVKGSRGQLQGRSDREGGNTLDVELAPLQPLTNAQWDIELALGDDIVLRVSRH